MFVVPAAGLHADIAAHRAAGLWCLQQAFTQTFLRTEQQVCA
jgi:hypothetical protein